MADIDVGTLTAYLKLRDELTPAMQQIAQSVSQISNQLKEEFEKTEGAGKKLGESVKEGFGIGMGIEIFNTLKEGVMKVGEAFISAAEHSLEFADKTEKAAEKMHVNLAATQEIAFAYGTMDLSIEDAAKGFDKMEKALGAGSAKTSAALKDLGLDLNTLRNESPDKAMTDLGTALGKVDNASRLAADASAVLGKGYATQLPVLKELAELRQKAIDQGAVVNPEDLEATAEMDKNVKVLKLSWDGLINNFIDAIMNSKALHVIMETLINTVGMASKFVQAHREEIRGFAADTINYGLMAVEGLILGFIGLVEVLKVVADGAVLVGAGLKETFLLMKGIAEVTIDPFNAGKIWEQMKIDIGNTANAADEAQDKIGKMADKIQGLAAHGVAQVDEFRKGIVELGNAQEVTTAKTHTLTGKSTELTAEQKKQEDQCKKLTEELVKMWGPLNTDGMTAYEKGLYKINEETDKYILKLNDVDKDGNLKMKQSDIDLLTEEAYRWQDVSIAIAENTHIREQDALGVKTATKAEDEYRAAHEALHPSLQGTINAIHEKEVAEQKSVIALNLDNNELTNAIILQIKHTAQLQIERAEIEATSKAYGDLSTVLGGIGDLVGGKGGGLLSGLGGLSGALKGIGGTKGISNTIGDMFSNGADEEGMGGSTMKFAMNFVGGIAKFMPIAGAAVGLATSVISMFHKPEFEKIAKELGKELGTDISDETAKAIEATEKKLNVSRAMAEALNVDKIIGEAGLSDKTFAMVGDLMKGIADGSIPAAEGMDELDKAFQKVSESSPAAAIAMMKQAKVLGEELTPAMQKYLDVQHKLMAEGADEIGKGLALSGAETFGSQFGTDAAQFFVMGFAEEIAQNGLLSALDSQKDNINKMFDEFQKAGNEDAMALLQPYKNLEDVINGADTALKGTLTTFSGMEKVFQGLSKAGDLTLSNFQAMERSISKVNDDLTKQGITGDASMQIQHQALQDIIDAHNTYGYVIDENTQKLIDQEIAAGHAFKTDPIVGLTQALNDLIVTLGGVPSAINAVSNSIDNMHTTPGGGVDTGGHNSGAPTSDYNNYAQQQQQAHQFHAASGMDMVLGYGPLPGGASGILAHPGEHVQITPAGQSRTSDTSITFAPVININGSGLSKAEVLQMVDKDIKDNVFGLQTRIKRVMEGRY